ncbi:MAG: hypothetical protein KC613_26605 [Myxococcales bacterium]|nr:hypothetical protein [Myxococcales bacterium]MCB9525496.1 hypothetical protein [Myxococcales bacterium]
MSRGAASAFVCVAWSVLGCDGGVKDPEYSPSTPYTGEPANDVPGEFRVRRDSGVRADAGPDVGVVVVDAAVDAEVDAVVDMAAPDMTPDAGLDTCQSDNDCVFAVDLNGCNACPTVVTQARVDAERCVVAHNAQLAYEAYEPLDCGGNCRVVVDQFCARPLGLAACDPSGACVERRVE